MSNSRPRSPRRRVIVLVALALVVVAALSIAPWRHYLLRAAGHALVSADPSRTADVIVISTDSDGEGVLEAADLVKEGRAAKVAVFSDPPDNVDREFIRRGVPYFNAAAISIQQLHALGIAAVEQMPPTVTGTEDEGRQLPQWCLERGFHTIIFVSTADHSRRSRRVLGRSMRPGGLEVVVRPSRYSEFDPDAWWLSRGGIRTEIVESEKLLLDVLRHPLS